MRFPKPDISDIEKSLVKLSNGNEDINLLEKVATQHEAMPFCGEAALLQFIITWARNNKGNGLFKLDRNLEEIETKEYLKEQLSYPYNVAAWIMSGKIEDAKERKIPRTITKSFEDFIDAMDNYEFEFTHNSKEDRVNLICIQGSKREFIRPFYEHTLNNNKVKPFGEFRVVIQDILARLNRKWQSNFLQDLSIPISNLIRELVDNSHDWARRDESNIEYEKGIRSVSFRSVKIDSDNESAFSLDNSHLSAYIATQLLKNERAETIPKDNKSIRRLTFLEISIVDSGPGLAKRWSTSIKNASKGEKRTTQLNLEEEERYFIECFKKWHSTSQDPSRGIGLFSVANTIKKQNGFIRIRSGRMCFLFGTDSSFKKIENLYKNYKRNNRLNESKDHIRLEDGTHVFTINGELTFYLQKWSDKPLGNACGTAYSILIPA